MGVRTGVIPWVKGEVKYMSNIDARHAMWNTIPRQMRAFAATPVRSREKSAWMMSSHAMVVMAMWPAPIPSEFTGVLSSLDETQNGSRARTKLFCALR